MFQFRLQTAQLEEYTLFTGQIFHTKSAKSKAEYPLFEAKL